MKASCPNQVLTLSFGKPVQEKPATFSRFVLPFAYRPRSVGTGAKKAESAGWLYEEGPPVDDSRISYFTQETGLSLFRRARWLILHTPTKDRAEQDADVSGQGAWHQTRWAKGFKINRQGKTIWASISAPRMLLFEWDARQSVQSRQAGESFILQSGFLFIDLYFPENSEYAPPTLDDLLFINERFRYFRPPHDEMDKECRQAFQDLPDTCRDAPGNQGPPPGDSPSVYTSRWYSFLTIPVRIDNKSYQLVPDEPRDPRQAHQSAKSLSHENEEPLFYADERMYVWSAAVLPGGVNDLKSAFKTSRWQAPDFGHWIKLLNVDSPGDCPSRTHHSSTAFDKEWAGQRTYHRWEAAGTWYGFSYHSGVMLCGEKFDDGKPTPFCDHFRRMYFDIAVLLFYLRVALFRFSWRLSEIMIKEGTVRQVSEGFESLRDQFNRFTILYQYPLLSNQQQAIEMYTIAREHFDIKEFYDEVKREIDDRHNFQELINQKKLSNAANNIASYGLAIGAMALLAGFWGMEDMYVSNLFKTPPGPVNFGLWLQVAITFGVGAATWFVVKWWRRRHK